METDAALKSHWTTKLHKCVPSSHCLRPLLLPEASLPETDHLPPLTPTLSSPRRRLTTLKQPAHTPEESLLAWGLAKPDNRQRGTEEIKRWGAPSTAAMDVEAVEAATAAV